MQQSSPVDMQKVCGNMKFPATKEQIIDEARKMNLSSDIMDALQSCPNRQYNSCDDISQECKSKMRKWGIGKAIIPIPEEKFIKIGSNQIKYIHWSSIKKESLSIFGLDLSKMRKWGIGKAIIPIPEEKFIKISSNQIKYIHWSSIKKESLSIFGLDFLVKIETLTNKIP